MTTKTISTRSNAVLTRYVETCDRLKALAHEAKELERLEKELRSAVIEQLDGETPRPVTIRKALRIVRIGERKSVSITDETKALEYARANGLKVSTRTAEYVAAATLRTPAIEGRVPQDVATVTTERIVIVE